MGRKDDGVDVIQVLMQQLAGSVKAFRPAGTRGMWAYIHADFPADREVDQVEGVLVMLPLEVVFDGGDGRESAGMPTVHVATSPYWTHQPFKG